MTAVDALRLVGRLEAALRRLHAATQADWYHQPETNELDAACTEAAEVLDAIPVPLAPSATAGPPAATPPAPEAAAEGQHSATSPSDQSANGPDEQGTPDGVQTCKRCGVTKPLSAYRQVGGGHRHKTCSDCVSTRAGAAQKGRRRGPRAPVDPPAPEGLSERDRLRAEISACRDTDPAKARRLTKQLLDGGYAREATG